MLGVFILFLSSSSPSDADVGKGLRIRSWRGLASNGMAILRMPKDWRTGSSTCESSAWNPVNIAERLYKDDHCLRGFQWCSA